MVATENTKLKTYYTRMYPFDKLGQEIDGEKTFSDLFDCLDRYGEVYPLIGVWDSVVRERLFDGLSKVMGVPYSTVYNQWIEGALRRDTRRS